MFLSTTMLRLLVFAYGLFLICILPLVSPTVVQDFNHVETCKDSLYMGTPPRGIIDTGLKKICQRYADKPRYVTLYDPKRRIPVYSAYSFKKTEGDRRMDSPWMYEPQLADVDGNGNMLPFPVGYLHMKFEDSQATLDDYSDVVLYERGQLNPDQHQSEPHDRTATYSLTNVVPQIREFSIGPWREYEEQIRVRLNNFCRGTAFIVTGVTTRGNMIRRNNQDRVAIPEDLWSAYCCTEYDRNAPHNIRVLFPSFAAIAKNAKEGNSVNEMPVQELEALLKRTMVADQNLQIFYDNCLSPSPLPLYLQHTV
ncbi:endonuclease domain-containing 1 protein [Antennarius striatus]|uniref:endonuclease domain-containing 1 protein n=1 Tax=Antennarius striatus TaxID=241820 RepID=UPI0035AF949B